LFGFVLALVLLLGFCAPAVRAQGVVSIEAHPQLFATMCALYATGHDAETGGVVHPIRARVRARMSAVRGPATDALREFYRNHRSSDPAATLSRYVSFALVVGPAPKFEFLGKRETLPPDAAALEGFNDILGAFYAEAQIAELWQQVRGEYEKEVRRLQEPVSRVIVVSSSYLRELLDPQGMRRFYVYLEPLVGAKTNVRSYGDVNVIVMNPAAEIPVDDIRHAFLHFVLDPLALRYRAQVEARKPILDLAARAPRLPAEFTEEIGAFFTENLVRAAELRLRRMTRSEMELALSQADLEGFVLVRPLYRELEKFEKAEPAMTYYYPDLVRGVSVSEEIRRVQKMEFAAAVPAPAPGTAPQISALEQELIAAERLIAAQNGEAAAEAFSSILAREPANPRALYGYAVASIMQRESDRAKDYFRRLLQPATDTPHAPVLAAGDPRILAWSHVYLGRIYDVEGNRELALSEYRAAMAVEGAPEVAKNAAKRGIEQGFGPAKEPARKP
jgi:tetratricopeptide (TPR) repeat protein